MIIMIIMINKLKADCKKEYMRIYAKFVMFCLDSTTIPHQWLLMEFQLV